MMKKLIVIVLAILLAFSVTGCGTEESLYKNYDVTHDFVVTTVKYGDKTLDATEVNFAEADTPETLYSVFGESEEGKCDVSFTGNVETANGKVVIGIKTGAKPRMAGVYIVGFGYFFVDGEIAEDKEFAIVIKNVPYGTFSMKTFSIIEDSVIIGSEVLSFTKNGQVYQEGENNGEFFSEVGVFDCKNGSYTSLSNTLLAVAKSVVFKTGSVKANITGNAGILLGVKGTSVTDVSLASYVFFGIESGKVCIIEFKNGNSVVKKEQAIANYDLTKKYEIKAESTGETVKLYLDGVETLSDDITIEQNRNIGIKFLTKDSTISNISYPETTLNAYKEFVKSEFDRLVKVELYQVVLGNSVSNSNIQKNTIDYSKDNEDESVKRVYDKAVKAISEVEDMASAVSVFDKQFTQLNEKVMERYQAEAFSSIADVADKWYTVIEKDGFVASYNVGVKNPAYGIDYDIMIEGTPYLKDVAVHDHRWWIPEPLRIPIIRSSAYRKIFACNDKEMLSVMYEEYYDAILRAVCQKAYEVYYSVRMSAFTAGDSAVNPGGALWPLLWNYCNKHESGGTIKGFEFTYNGPVDEYKGKVYGTLGENELQFKLSPMLYNFEDANVYKANVTEIVSGFKAGMQWLSTGVEPQ